MLLDGSYDQSVAVLNHAKTVKGMVTKSSIMLGLGERDEEIKQTMLDLRAIGVDIFTLGQYLQVRRLEVLIDLYAILISSLINTSFYQGLAGTETLHIDATSVV